jgi:hypothetical protein
MDPPLAISVAGKQSLPTGRSGSAFFLPAIGQIANVKLGRTAASRRKFGRQTAHTSAPPLCDMRFSDAQINHAVANDGDAFMLSRQFVQLGGDAFGPLLGVPIRV